MKNNLEFYYFQNATPKVNEGEIIKCLNPPLNLLKNKNAENLKFRTEVSRLRKIK